MRSKPMASKIFAETFSNTLDRQAAGICGNDAAGLAHRFNFPEQVALDFQIFGNSFDDPIGVSQQFQVILEVAEGDQPF